MTRKALAVGWLLSLALVAYCRLDARMVEFAVELLVLGAIGGAVLIGSALAIEELFG